MPAAASAEVAAVVVSRLGLRPGELLLELGAGTGELGSAFARRLPAGVSYLGLDLSLGMLTRFGERIRGGEARLGRILADGSRRWPLAEGSASAIFCSRAAHRLDADVFLAETRRVLRPGGRVVFGSLERSSESVRSALQRRMRELLAEVTGEPGAGRDRRRRHRELAAALGGGERVEAAAFEVMETPARALAGWRSKAGLAGLALAAEVQEEVLGRLETWAHEQYVDLERPRPAIERYELLIARLGEL